MNDLQKGIYQIVVQEIKKAMPKKEENLLSKQDAEKIIKKYTLMEFLTATDAASVLGMSITQFWRIRQKYDVPVYVIGGMKRYKKSDLLKFIEENCVKGYA
ncbi:MAG: helix-turn-helix domain-containing protein [Candidatus Lactobacillus pullistercoris]|uniref:Helix-turn-helix domain-containing protein n=1 Tax=Candidatus Lactobacillus pullistercoris TaxID=2838636 RepID=A0A9E2KSR2_9LACO|nr:helix-turn-helix domain-containing protein [Candidatus Lactobacillus pullistercoris]